MWLTELKIAIVEKNPDALEKLLDNIPELKDPEDIQSAIHLLNEASELMQTLKDETASNMKKIEKNLSFLRSTEEKAKSRLDIKL